MDKDQKGDQPGWVYKPGDSTSTPTETPAASQQTSSNEQPAASSPADSTKKDTKQTQEAATWTASEFIANHKNAGWYVVLFGAIVLISGLTYLLTKDIISTTMILVGGTLFAFLASHKPRQLTYSVDSSGVTIGDKFYPYHSFKSFAILREDAIGYINLMPLKRFMPDVSIYYPPEEEDKIINVLSASLPNDQKAEHSFDKLMKKIRF